MVLIDARMQLEARGRLACRKKDWQGQRRYDAGLDLMVERADDLFKRSESLLREAEKSLPKKKIV